MKRLLVVYLLCIGIVHAKESFISRGGLTEAVFIIQNKHNDLSDYIMRLKKMLAQCLIMFKERGKGHSRSKEIACYHCSFKEKLFSSSIKELEELLNMLNNSLLDLSKKEQITHSCVQSHVDRAFLIKRKIDAESLLVDHMLKACREKDSLVKTKKSLELSLRKNDDLKKLASTSARAAQSLRRLERTSSFLKRAMARLHVNLARNRKVVNNLQSSLRKIDSELYKGYKAERKNILVEEEIA